MQCGAELRAVAKFGMRVQWQVRTVNGKIIFEQPSNEFVALARPRVRRTPKKSVMHEEEVGFGRDRQAHGGKAGVHGGGNARNVSPVFDLKSVHRTVPIVERFRAQKLIAVTNDGGERGV